MRAEPCDLAEMGQGGPGVRSQESGSREQESGVRGQGGAEVWGAALVSVRPGLARLLLERLEVSDQIGELLVGERLVDSGGHRRDVARSHFGDVGSR